MLSPEKRGLLLDIANIGCHRGLVLEARAVYLGVLAEKPGFAPALVGLAFSHVVVDEFIEAERILKEEVLAANPDDSEALAVLGLCALLDKRAEDAREILAVPARGDGAAAVFAKELLAVCK